MTSRILTADELAKELRFKHPTAAFYSHISAMGITPVPGRRGHYDRRLVDRRLDEAAGLTQGGAVASEQPDIAREALAARRARRGAD